MSGVGLIPSMMLGRILRAYYFTAAYQGIPKFVPKKKEQIHLAFTRDCSDDRHAFSLCNSQENLEGF